MMTSDSVSTTNLKDGVWAREVIDAVWNKATVINGYDPNSMRQDVCDTWIKYSEYGKTDDDGCGWVIDHIKPVAMHGTDELSNLQPLQWENNRCKGDNWPNWTCAKIAS
jgi:hypothetical protein